MKDNKGTSGNVGWNNSARSRLYMFRNSDNDGDHSITLRHMKSNKGRRQPDLQLGNFSGVIRNLTPEEVENVSGDEEARSWFLHMLYEATKQNRRVGTSPKGNYAPRIFIEMGRKLPDNPGCSVTQLTDAMNYLLTNNRVKAVESDQGRTAHLVLCEGSS
jgi:hypothetical protein